ncbi:hypothetical protein D0860_06037 [Hortaea werneckii]|uniref:Uncharacterized protein n=1 Tax=Hortaea werneckii TaxID=91943 RepID=A0A3M7GVZ1_HORWE|nr:hypothetical protein D0860_06037 [Hortaea werneckii]
MARPATKTTGGTSKPGLLSRLRHRNSAKVTKTESTNPITGTHTVTKKTKTHPHGAGHHGHGGSGPMASSRHSHHTRTRTHRTTTTRTPAAHHRRKASLGDKVSGALMKLKGSLTHKPDVKAAGTRRMHGTDGKGSRSRY